MGTETFLICLNSNDLSTYKLVLQSIAVFMRAAVDTRAADALFGSVTMIALLWDVFTSHGDIRRINYGKYVIILFVYSFLFAQTADLRLVEYDPIKGSTYSGDGKTYATVQYMPYIPAYLLSSVYELSYNFNIWIDRSFYQQPTAARTGLMDKVMEYTELYGGIIKDSALSDKYLTFVKNVFLRDINHDSKNNDINVLRGNNAKNLMEAMYKNGPAIAGVTSHAGEDLYIIENKETSRYNIANYDQVDPDIFNDQKMTPTFMMKREFYLSLMKELYKYYDNKISEYQTEHPDFFILNDYKRLKEQIDKGEVNKLTGKKIEMPEDIRNYVLMMTINGTSGKLAGQSAADVYTLSKSAIENAEAAKNNANFVKMSLKNIIDIGLLMLMMAFPVVFVLSFLPQFLRYLTSYIGGFILLAFAGPAGFAAEKILDSFLINDLANKIAGSAAGLSATTQSGILSLYNMYPWITLAAYGMIGGMIFSMGRGAQFLGNLATRMMPNLDRVQTGVLTGNESLGARSYEALSVMTGSAFQYSQGSYSLNSVDMNRAQAQLDYYNKNGIDAKTKNDLLSRGAVRIGDDGRLEVSDAQAMSKYAMTQDNVRQFEFNKQAALDYGRSTLGALQQLGNYQAKSDTLNIMNNARTADEKRVNDWILRDSFSEMVNLSATSWYSQGGDSSFQAHVGGSFGIGGATINASDRQSYQANQGRYVTELYEICRDVGRQMPNSSREQISQEIEKRVLNTSIDDGKSNANFQSFYKGVTQQTVGGMVSQAAKTGTPLSAEIEKKMNDPDLNPQNSKNQRVKDILINYALDSRR